MPKNKKGKNEPPVDQKKTVVEKNEQVVQEKRLECQYCKKQIDNVVGEESD